MATALTAIQDLPLLSFQGLEPAPYDTAGFSWSHRHGRNTFVNVNGATHPWTGLNPFPLPVRMHFINGINNRIDWFPDLWNEWMPVLLNGEPGRLTHPLLGDVDAVVTGGSVTLVARHTAGVIVDVTFENTLKDPEQELTFEPLTLNLESLVSLFIEESENAGIEPPSQESVTDITDAAAIANGFASQVNMAAAGAINSAKGIAGEYIALVRAESNPALQVLEDIAVLIWVQFDEAGKKIAKNARNTATKVVQGDSSIAAIAAEEGNTEQEIMALNPDLLATPIVSRGTRVRFYS
jgi:hypothetical protein